MDNNEIRLSQMGHRLAELTKQAGLTQKDVAEALDASAGYVSQIFRGQVSPTLRWIFDLADLLDTTSAYIIGGVVNDGTRTLPKKEDIDAMHGMYKRGIMDSDLYIQFLEKKLKEVAI